MNILYEVAVLTLSSLLTGAEKTVVGDAMVRMQRGTDNRECSYVEPKSIRNSI